MYALQVATYTIHLVTCEIEFTENFMQYKWLCNTVRQNYHAIRPFPRALQTEILQLISSRPRTRWCTSLHHKRQFPQCKDGWSCGSKQYKDIACRNWRIRGHAIGLRSLYIIILSTLMAPMSLRFLNVNGFGSQILNPFHVSMSGNMHAAFCHEMQFPKSTLWTTIHDTWLCRYNFQISLLRVSTGNDILNNLGIWGSLLFMFRNLLQINSLLRVYFKCIVM